jgi:methanogenic corrinoid protein MtbC1
METNGHSHADAPDLDEALHQRRFLAQLLLATSDQIAEQAASLLVERWQDISGRYNPMAFDRWRESITGRVADLAAAVQAGRPEVFCEQVRWSRSAFEARGVPTDDLLRSIDVLGEAVERQIPEGDRAMVMEFLTAAGKALHEATPTPPSTITTSTAHGRLAARYLLAVLEGDRRAASDIIVTALREGRLSFRDCYEQVFLPVQQEVGRMWHMNDLTVAEEHFTTATTILVMGQIYAFMPRAASNAKTVVAASVQGNAHDMGVRMVADYFEMSGWRSVYLGPSVPATDLATAVDHFDADLVALSAYLPSHLRVTEDTIAATRSHPKGRSARIIVGGPAFQHAENAWREMGADGYARSAIDAVRTAHEMFALPMP